jgi:hypothetical protein
LPYIPPANRFSSPLEDCPREKIGAPPPYYINSDINYMILFSIIKKEWWRQSSTIVGVEAENNTKSVLL